MGVGDQQNRGRRGKGGGRGKDGRWEPQKSGKRVK